ncbi:MAG: FGGY family carbohydrate kinase, partial [Nitrososphaerota archaeon]
MYLLGIDVGTSGTKSIIFDLNGKIISRAYVEYPLIFPDHGFIEQNPEIWWDATIKTIKNAMEKESIKASEINCVGLSGHTNTPSFIDKSGKPLYNSIVWMDRRAEKQANAIHKKIGNEKIHKITGVKIDPFYSVYKVLWLKENYPNIIEKIHAILQPKDYIGLKLTGEFFLDKALASSSGYLDINKGEYAYDLLEEIGFPIEKLPKLVLPYEIVGEVNEEAARLIGLKKGTPVVAGSGDVMVNAIGCGTIEAGS